MSHPIPGPSHCTFSSVSDSFRISNVHQGFSPFLDQLANGKDAMSLVHELCNIHRVKPEYELTNVTGPDHAKLFTVYLKLETEKYTGQGSSIRSAQQNAAKMALTQTRLKFPMRNKGQRKPKQPADQGRSAKNPVDQLNSTLMKKGVQARFESNRHSYLDQQQKPVRDAPGSMVPYPFMASPFQPVYHHIPLAVPYGYYPTYCYDPYTNKHYFVHELANPSYVGYSHPYHHHHHSMDSNNVKIESEIVERKLGEDLFVTNVEFEGSKFSGYGKSSRDARQAAAEKALDHLKQNLFKSLRVDASDVPKESTKEDQNPISLLYTMAARNRQKISFDLVNAYGKVHLPTFIFRCQLFDTTGRLIFEAEGKDRSKKAAKQRAAENLLKKLDAGRHQPESSPQDLSENSELESSVTLDSISNKSLVQLYDLARNMSFLPTFHYQKFNLDHAISKKFSTMTKSEPGRIYRIECVLSFEQPGTPKKTFQMKSLGFAPTPRLAKQVACFIIILKIGQNPHKLDVSDIQFNQSLKFSLLENFENFPLNLQEKIEIFSKEMNLDIFYEEESNQTTDLRENQIFKVNYNFVMFIFKKFYYYTLKDSMKRLDLIEEKMKFLLANFKNTNPEFQSDHLDNENIKEIISQLNLKEYWDHSRLIEKLLIIGTDLEPGSVIRFRCHFCMNNFENQNSIAIVNVQLNESLTKENFQLIQRKFITFSFGSNENEAREAAILRTIRNMATNAFMKNSMANRIPGIIHVNPDDHTKMSSSNRPSANQMKSKQCISYMYQVCRDLFIKKPEFSYYKCNQIPGEPELLGCRCNVDFKQEYKQLSAKLCFIGISNNKRLSRTIASYIFLCNFNISSFSLSNLDVYDVPGFDHFLQLSLTENRYNKICDRIIDHGITYNSEQLEQINQNIEFIIHLLKDVYQSFLKNHKQSDPAILFPIIAENLFEYHNHQKQIADDSDSFDQWSERIHKWIDDTMTSFDATRFWDHLRFLSLIGSTLNSDLFHPLEKPVFQFKYQLIETESNATTIAIINLDCCSIFQDRYPLFQKEFLSFSLDTQPEEAREMASYKALRYLAINFWK